MLPRFFEWPVFFEWPAFSTGRFLIRIPIFLAGPRWGTSPVIRELNPLFDFAGQFDLVGR